MRKFWVLLLIFLAIMIGGAYVGSGYLLKNALENRASLILGTQVEISSVVLSPMAGSLHVGGVKIHNPGGFTEANAFEVSGITVKAAPFSLFKKTVVIDSITAEHPILFFELGINGNNLYNLQRNAARYSNKIEEAHTYAQQKKLVIHTVALNQTKLLIPSPDVTNPEAKPLEMALNDVVINDVGDAEKPANVAAALVQVIRGVLTKLPLTDNTVVRDSMGAAKDAVGGAADAMKKLLGR
jgi:hypothetical protein